MNDFNVAQQILDVWSPERNAKVRLVKDDHRGVNPSGLQGVGWKAWTRNCRGPEVGET